jgi:TonB family protein
MAVCLLLLTPTDGVDFTKYLKALFVSLQNHWVADMPKSARKGKKGNVVVEFQILRNGTISKDEPALHLSSGAKQLDRAAVETIRASAPFQPLPLGFLRPSIRVCVIFAYNLLSGQEACKVLSMR